MKGIIAVYKPKGPTSHDVVDRIRRLTGERRVGHAGTLDPLASGVLVVGIGREATKQLAAIVAKEKEYVATIRLGATSATDDAEGTKTLCRVMAPPARAAIMKTLPHFTGHIVQAPPAYSAIKIRGKKAYALARKGKTPQLRPRPVEIKSITLLSYRWPYLKIRAATGPGVYIRALARDIGAMLGVGAYLADLVRIRVGEFTLRNARRLPLKK